MSLAAPAFSLPFRPHPPARARRALFPAGRGRLKVILCKGLRPLHPRGLNPGGTCLPSRCGARRGACPGVAGSAGVGGTLRGACLLCRPPTPPLAFFSAPYPPDPLPLRGRGRLQVILCKGLRPLHPRGLNPGGTGYPCPGGEDHLKRRSSSPPVPPLLGCRLCSPVPRPNRRPPRWVPLTPAEPATLGASPPRAPVRQGL